MKNKFKLFLLIFTLFILVGCDNGAEDILSKLPDDIKDQITDLLPSVELVGEDLILVEQYTTFIDPGAEVPGDFDLTISVVSNVDTTVLGDYTVTYNIEYDGITYSGTRTVRVIEATVVVDVLPVITITGDELVVLEQYATFIDLGATVSGDLGLILTVVSNVDTTILGDYTVTYTVVYKTITYTVTRSVKVVEPYVYTDFQWTVESVSVTNDIIGVHVYYKDSAGLLTNGKGSLYQGDTLIRSYPISTGDNYLNYTGLQSNSDYTFKVEGSYLENNTTVTLSGLEITMTTKETTSFVVSLTNEVITYNSYKVDITVDAASSNILSKKAILYLGEFPVKVVDLTTTDTAFSVEGLLGGTQYILKVVYTATPSDGGAVEETSEVLSMFVTDTLSAPSFVFLLCEEGYSTVECTINIDTTGFFVSNVRIDLYKNGVYDDYYDVDDGDNVSTMYNLDAGTEYTLKLYVDYRPSNSFVTVEDALIHEVTITTKVRTTVVENMVITTVLGTPNTTTFEFDILDPDNTIDGVTSLTLYSGGYSRGYVDAVVGHNVIVLTGYSDYDNRIYPNTLYTVKVTTRYLEDAGTMSSTTILSEDVFLTQPDVKVTSYEIEKSMYFSGDKIILILELDNDEEMDIEYVVVNGETILKEDFLFPSNFYTIYLSMGVETDYTNFYYNMTGYGVKMVDDSIYVADYDETLDVRIHQAGDIDPLDSTVSVLEITADDYTKQISDSVTNYTNITIRLENEYNLDVYSITFGGQVFLSPSFEVGSTAKQIILRVEVDSSYNGFWVGGLVFVRNDENIIAPSSDYYVELINIRGYYVENAVGISTPAELNSITPGSNKYYYLTQDIDLTGFPMQPIGTKSTPFSGIFDGRGFTISNYSYTLLEADQDRDVYVGLFGISAAFIYNLTIFNSDITIVTNETHQIFVGILAGSSSGDIIDVTTLGTNTITITGLTQGKIGGLIGYQSGFVRDASAKTDIIINGLEIDKDLGIAYDTYVGGLFGIAGTDNIDTSSSNGTISITNTVNNTNHVGGLIGKFVNNNYDSATRNYISNSFASVDIYTSNYGYGSAGGLVGTLSNGYAKNSEVRNSYASGDVYTYSGDLGGLIGDSFAYVTDCFATGDVDTFNGSGYKLTEPAYDTFFNNSYVYDGQTVSYKGVPKSYISKDIDKRITTASIKEYNSEDFYTRVLGWNTYFWDFDDLIASADILPEHR